MMRMTFWAAALKLSAAVFKVVVDSFRVSSSSLAAATLRGAPVYVNWLSGAGLLLPVLSAPSAGVPLPVVSPDWVLFSSLPVVSPSEPEVPLPPEPLLPLSEPEVGVLDWFLFPSPPVVVSGWSFSVDWFSFSSPLPVVEDVLPLVSPG